MMKHAPLTVRVTPQMKTDLAELVAYMNKHAPIGLPNRSDVVRIALNHVAEHLRNGGTL